MKGTEWEYVPQPKQRRHPFFSQDNDTNPNNKQKKKVLISYIVRLPSCYVKMYINTSYLEFYI